MTLDVIRVDRARRAIRLAFEYREIGLGTEHARQHVLGTLLSELGAVIGGAVDDRAFRVGGRRGCVRATLAGFDASTIGVYRVHDDEGSDFNPCLRAVMERRASGEGASVATAAHQEIVPLGTWERSAWLNEFVRPAHVAHFLSSIRYVGPGRVEGFGFMRAAGDAPFDDEDRSFLHLVHLECPDLFGREAQVVRLAPRVRATLECLLTGASDKEIALHLGISAHTARQYVKTLFRAFGVGSRAQLIAHHRRASLL